MVFTNSVISSQVHFSRLNLSIPTFLSSKLQCLQVLDSDLGGTLSHKELCVGLRKINFVPPIHLSRSFSTNTGNVQISDDS